MLGDQAIFSESLVGDPSVGFLGAWAVSFLPYQINGYEHRGANATGTMTT